MNQPKKNNVQIRVRTYDRPYRGKRIKAKDYPGRLPHAEPWPWQVKPEEKGT